MSKPCFARAEASSDLNAEWVPTNNQRDEDQDLVASDEV